MVHLIPLLVNDLLAHCCCFHALSALLNLLVDPLMILGHNLVQLLVPILCEEGTTRLRTFTFFNVFLLFVIYLVTESYH